MKTPLFSFKNLVLALFICANGVGQVHAQSQANSWPASTNINKNGYPRILDDLRVVFNVKAPNAQSVQIDLGKLYAMNKDEQGVWSVTTEPQVPGFHYYSLVIDGVKVADPASESFYGMSRQASAIEIPEKGVDFYHVKDVPHGALSSKYYYSNVTKSWRRLFVYTPAGYNENTALNYPVVYIQHGGGEDERGWAVQGFADVILDNLIASGKAKPMLIVIANGNVSTGGGGYSSAGMASFKEEMCQNIVPFIDKTYRTLPNAANRALCGLSMGGGQAFYTGLVNLNIFAHVGVFSSGIFGGINSPTGSSFDAEKEIPGLLSQSVHFNSKLKLFYISVGQQDPRFSFTSNAVKNFQDRGLKVTYQSFPGDHEWQVWRKSLHDFATKVFKP